MQRLRSTRVAVRLPRGGGVRDPQGWDQADHVEDESPLAPTLKDYVNAVKDAFAARDRALDDLHEAKLRIRKTLDDLAEFVRDRLLA
jgi:hypothetical protein